MQCWPQSFKQGRIPDSLVRLKKFYHSQRITTWQTGRILPRILMMFQPAALASFSEQSCKTKQWKRKEHEERMSEKHIGEKIINDQRINDCWQKRKHLPFVSFDTVASALCTFEIRHTIPGKPSYNPSHSSVLDNSLEKNEKYFNFEQNFRSKRIFLNFYL